LWRNQVPALEELGLVT